MTRPIVMLLVGGLTLLIALITAAFFVAFERIEKTIPGPPTGHARQNPYLALQYLYERSDFLVDTHTRLPKSDNSGDEFSPFASDTIIWMASRHDAAPTQIDDLHHWVYNGGHLITVASDDKNDPLVNAFYLELSEKSPEPDDFSPTKTYKLDDQYAPVRTNPDADHNLYDAHNNIFAFSQSYGDGRITFFGSATPFTNPNIGKDDHAQAALDIINLDLPNTTDDDHELYSTTISIIQHGQRTSWFLHIATRFWPLFATLAVLLLLALANGRRRFGPLQVSHSHTTNPNNSSRRSRLEHIHAVGRFLWKHDAEHALLTATRNALLEKLTRRRPAIRVLQGNARYELIAEELDITPIAAKRIFEAPVPTQPRQFLESIRNLEDLRRNL